MPPAISYVACILLAAGTGSRFGSNKLLHPLEDGVAIAAHAARNLLAVTQDVIAVVRWDDLPLQEILEEEGCLVTMCRSAVRGMGASLAHGVAEARSADGWVVALADMPRIAPATLAAPILSSIPPSRFPPQTLGTHPARSGTLEMLR